MASRRSGVLVVAMLFGSAVLAMGSSSPPTMTSLTISALSLPIYCLLSVLMMSSFVQGSKVTASVDRFRHLKSYAAVRSQYKSDEHFLSMVQQHHTDFVTQHHAKSSQSSSVFFVEFVDRCEEEGRCHDVLRQHAEIGIHRHEILSSKHALVTASYDSLKRDFLSHELIEDVVALPSAFKMDTEIWNLEHPTDSVQCQYVPVPTKLVSTEKNLDIQPSSSNLRQSKTHPSGTTSDINYKQMPVEVRVFSHAPVNAGDSTLEAFLLTLQEKYGKDVLTNVEVNAPSSNTAGSVEVEDAVNYLIIDIKITDCLLVWNIVSDIAQRHDVLWISRQFPKFTLNAYAEGVCDSGIAEVQSVISQLFNGSHEVIGISDSGLDLYNCYFYDALHPMNYQTKGGPTVLNVNNRKVIQYVAFADTTDDSDAHGTHVCGSAAGQVNPANGNTVAEEFNGMSPGAKIAFFDIGKDGADSLMTPGNINTDLFQVLYPSGARIYSNSWGTSSNEYESEAQQTDQFMVSFPDTLVLFAGGNNGTFGANTIGSPATSKNALTVGAASNDHKSWVAYTGSNSAPSYLNKNSVAFFSSQGPTADKRMKPDILAPGYFIKSALGYDTASSEHCDTSLKSGTSMATPVTAGMVVKVRQYFLQGYYPSGTKRTADQFVPSGALLKAIMVHSGQAMDAIVRANSMNNPLTEYPSNIQGYGRVQLNSTLLFDNIPRPSSLFVIGGSTNAQKNYKQFTLQGQAHKYVVTSGNVTSGSFLRITLCYSDYPGSLLATSAMVNILQVTAKGNNMTYKAYAPADTTVSNLQMIDIENPAPNTNYTITITATTLLTSPQSYSLVVTGDIDSVQPSTPDSSGSKKPLNEWYIYLIIIVVAVIVLALFCSCLFWVCCRVRSPAQETNNDVTIEFYEIPGTHEMVAVPRENNPMTGRSSQQASSPSFRNSSSGKTNGNAPPPQRPPRSPKANNRPAPPKKPTRSNSPAPNAT